MNPNRCKTIAKWAHMPPPPIVAVGFAPDARELAGPTFDANQALVVVIPGDTFTQSCHDQRINASENTWGSFGGQYGH